jgi:hypothetical protein
VFACDKRNTEDLSLLNAIPGNRSFTLPLLKLNKVDTNGLTGLCYAPHSSTFISKTESGIQLSYDEYDTGFMALVY